MVTIFLKEQFGKLVWISLKFAPEGPVENKSALVQVMIVIQTLQKLSDLHRTGGPVNMWKIQVLLVLQQFHTTQFFLALDPLWRGSLQGCFLTWQQDRHNKGFHRSSTVFTGRGPRTGGFLDVWLITTTNMDQVLWSHLIVKCNP